MSRCLIWRTRSSGLKSVCAAQIIIGKHGKWIHPNVLVVYFISSLVFSLSSRAPPPSLPRGPSEESQTGPQLTGRHGKWIANFEVFLVLAPVRGGLGGAGMHPLHCSSVTPRGLCCMRDVCDSWGLLEICDYFFYYVRLSSPSLWLMLASFPQTQDSDRPKTDQRASAFSN